jgi:hypothetical protein
LVLFQKITQGSLQTSHSCIAAHQANIPQPQSDLLAAIPVNLKNIQTTEAQILFIKKDILKSSHTIEE